jgi:hypothetical protein
VKTDDKQIFLCNCYANKVPAPWSLSLAMLNPRKGLKKQKQKTPHGFISQLRSKLKLGKPDTLRQFKQR